MVLLKDFFYQQKKRGNGSPSLIAFCRNQVLHATPFFENFEVLTYIV